MTCGKLKQAKTENDEPKIKRRVDMKRGVLYDRVFRCEQAPL
jgi:hypothetical protein